MDGLVEQLISAVFSEYGAFVAFLLYVNFKLWKKNEEREAREVELVDKILSVVEANTEAATKLSGKIDHQKEVNNARNV